MLRRLVITAVLAAALFTFIYAFTLGPPQQPPPVSRQAIERTLPPPGDLVLRQSTVEADLAPGWTGTLVLDGQEIPPDQLNCITDCDRPLCEPSERRPQSGPVACRPLDPQYRVFFVPGPGKVIEELAPGAHQATVVYWPLDESREQARTYSWTFRVA